jgi:hypothetical protein
LDIILDVAIALGLRSPGETSLQHIATLWRLAEQGLDDFKASGLVQYCPVCVV